MIVWLLVYWLVCFLVFFFVLFFFLFLFIPEDAGGLILVGGWVFFGWFIFDGRFLDAFTHLYKRVCLSVGPSVRPSVRHTRVEFLRNEISGLNLNKIAFET